jgi:branched-chain amino acid transport system permease protein
MGVIGDLIQNLFTFTVLGLITAAAYAIASSGLVITYATSNVFNMAHGAIGMVSAFMFWQLTVPWGVPMVVSALLVVLVFAPLLGALLERTMMRHLTNASVTVSLTVTVGLFVLLLGLAQTVWTGGVARDMPPFFAGRSVGLAGINISYHDLLTLLLAGLVAAGLYLLLNRTRTGTGMRAIVDNRELLALHGARPHRLGMLSWAIGCGLAGLAGVMLASKIGFEYITLTLVVINAFAAAMVGRLKSLPRTFVGAILLGVVIEWSIGLGSTYLPGGIQDSDVYKGVIASLATIFLFGAMLALPQEKLRVGRVEGANLVALPSRQRALASGAVLVVVVGIATQVVGPGTTSSLGRGLALASIMLSLVLLAGYGGDMSLAQLTFAGFGALTVVKWGAPIFGGQVSVLSILAAGLVAGAFGALVALPALRLRGLYLGLGTLAFAVAMDEIVFKKPLLGFQLGGGATITRPSLFESEAASAVYVAIGFVLLALLVLELRRSRFGRLLLASRDSPAALSTLGQSITRTRVATFAIAAAIAGMGGVLLANAQVAVGDQDFFFFQNLPLLLLVVVGGITSITGALIGGLFLGLSPTITDLFPTVGGLLNLLIGFAAVMLGRNPNGIAGAMFEAWHQIRGEHEDDEPASDRVVDVTEDEDVEEVTVVGAS